jgi:ATP-dependent 26S proteasome regulatory subunit
VGYSNSMNPKELIEILESKLLQTPTNQEVKEQLAFLLLAQGNLARAESLFSDIIKLNPVSPSALWGLAKINWQRNSFEAAYSYMNLLSSMPNNKLTKEQALIFAKILAKKANYPEASKWLDAAIAQDSSLLQAEMPLLKFIKQNLVAAQNTDGSREGSMTGFPFPFPVPTGGPGKHTQYIVLEISQIVPGGSEPPIYGNEGMSFEEEDPEKEDLTQAKKVITFDQIGGLRKVKQFLIQEVALPLKNPQLCSAYNKSTNPKVLLYGPPGCGKSLLCRALAVETEINFFALRPANFVDLSFEECEMKLAHILQSARENKPTIILFDEIDWLAHSSSNAPGESDSYFYRSNLMKLLLDSLNNHLKVNDQIGLIATTSAPWKLDPAFFGSNKIGKHVYVGPPSAEDKAEILKLALEARQSAVVIPEKIDHTKIISVLRGIASGADIDELVDAALSDLLIETVVNIQNGAKDKKLLLSTERIIKSGRKLKHVPSVELWMNEARHHLKQKNSPLHHMWEQIEENDLNNSRSKTYRSIIKSRLLPSQ